MNHKENSRLVERLNFLSHKPYRFYLYGSWLTAYTVYTVSNKKLLMALIYIVVLYRFPSYTFYTRQDITHTEQQAQTDREMLVINRNCCAVSIFYCTLKMKKYKFYNLYFSVQMEIVNKLFGEWFCTTVFQNWWCTRNLARAWSLGCSVRFARNCSRRILCLVRMFHCFNVPNFHQNKRYQQKKPRGLWFQNRPCESCINMGSYLKQRWLLTRVILFSKTFYLHKQTLLLVFRMCQPILSQAQNMQDSRCNVLWSHLFFHEDLFYYNINMDKIGKEETDKVPHP